LSATTKCVLVAALVWLALPSGLAHGRSDVQRDVEGYAVASCLMKQKEPYLRDQGALWAGGIVQRSHGDVEDFRRVAGAVDADIAQKPMPAARRESDPMHAVPVPVPFCAEIIDDPPVRAVIDKTIKKLTPAYRRVKKSPGRGP
jgi:hypothetical protein